MNGHLRSTLPALVLGLLLPLSGIARTIVVHPGGSIRAALHDAKRGDRVQVLPGVYREGVPGGLNALTINASGIDLVGLPSKNRPVVLENTGGQSFGIWVSPPDSSGPGPQSDPEHPPCGSSGAMIHGFALSGFTVRGFAGHGVHLACVDGFSLTDNVADGNGVYGLFPVLSANGRVSRNEVMNTASDAAIYVGQSDNVLIADNRVHDNFVGIEVQNSRNSAVLGNQIHGNTVGLLIDVTPFVLRTTQTSTLVAYNQIHDNNRPNSAEPDDALSVLPSGIGLLVVGGDATTITTNVVTGNQFVGIGVVSVCLELSLLGHPCAGLDVEPFADGNRIVGNTVRGNGMVAIANPVLNLFRADLAWDGTGTGNCWMVNTFGTSVPPALPGC